MKKKCNIHNSKVKNFFSEHSKVSNVKHVSTFLTACWMMRIIPPPPYLETSERPFDLDKSATTYSSSHIVMH